MKEIDPSQLSDGSMGLDEELFALEDQAEVKINQDIDRVATALLGYKAIKELVEDPDYKSVQVSIPIIAKGDISDGDTAHVKVTSILPGVVWAYVKGIGDDLTTRGYGEKIRKVLKDKNESGK